MRRRTVTMLSTIGFHVNKTHEGKSRPFATAINDIDVIVSRGLRPCAQIFVTGPQSAKVTVTAADKIALKAYPARLVVHGAYIDNPWASCSAYSIGNIVAEMRIAAEIGATGVVVHLSNSTNTGLEAVLAALDAELGADSPTLWLEIHATKATSASFETPAKLGALFKRVHAWRRAHVGCPIGLCIDSAHLHACGTNLTTYDMAMDWLKATELAVVAPIMVHLNDSLSALGSGVDKHAPLTQGTIWGGYGGAGILPVEQSGLMAILDWADDAGATVILERAAGIADDLDLIARLGHFA